MNLESSFITYGHETISYQVLYLHSRTTLAIEVHPDRRVLVRAPKSCSAQVVAERLQKRAAWISRQLVEFDRYRPRTPGRQYLSGETHQFLGRQYRLKIIKGAPDVIKLSRGELRLVASGIAESEQVRNQLQHWYREQANIVFAQTMQQCLQQFRKVQSPRLAIRTMQSRWGSLSRKGTMTINLNLIRAPRPCIEYVVMHELCHLVHRDHDAKFFKLLSSHMPDWQKRKRRLELALL